MTYTQFSTGVVYTRPAMPEWGLTADDSCGPEWHRNPAMTADVASQLRALGYTVTEVTR